MVSSREGAVLAQSIGIGANENETCLFKNLLISKFLKILFSNLSLMLLTEDHCGSAGR